MSTHKHHELEARPSTTDPAPIESGFFPRARPEVVRLGCWVEELRAQHDVGSAGDLATTIATNQPRYHRMLRGLRHEHEQLIARGERIYERARGLDEDALREELDALAAGLAAHDSAEIELLQDALLIDIGGSG